MLCDECGYAFNLFIYLFLFCFAYANMCMRGNIIAGLVTTFMIIIMVILAKSSNSHGMICFILRSR